MVAVKLVMDMSASLLQKRIILSENTHTVDVKAVPHFYFLFALEILLTSKLEIPGLPADWRLGYKSLLLLI